ncbi:RICIN domain-containing protein [Actinoplanes sp. NPDC049681]|uniref:RICIN domain-containing protein n=1 Tax=Actinoplanes sp. NPDC049681 TaxID=3363905 RepID=UPI0037AB24B8
MILRPLFQGRDRDDAGALYMYVLLTLVGTTLSALLLPIVLAQVSSARRATQRDHALHAAQAGLDVAIGRIRAAHDPTGTGVKAKLPCGPLVGNVDPTGAAQYDVTIVYLPSDPQGRPESWISTNKMFCVEGSGPSSVPGFALLISKGTDRGRGARTLRGTYVFSTNTSSPGGIVRAYSSNPSVLWCLDAGSGTPAAGDAVNIRKCLAGSPAQLFAYTDDFTLVLVASKTAARPLGMCLDTLDGKAASVEGNVIRFQPCGAAVPPYQQWSYRDDSRTFRGTNDGHSINSFCLTVQSPNTVGSRLVLGSTCSPLANPQTTFWPPTNLTTGPLKDLAEN